MTWSYVNFDRDGSVSLPSHTEIRAKCNDEVLTQREVKGFHIIGSLDEMSDYAHVAGGSLKFKGEGEKKKKKKSHSTTQHDKVTTKLQETAKIAEVKEKEKDKLAALRGEREGSGSISPRAAPPPENGIRMTEAERRYYEKQKQRREERAKKAAPTTHKDRITELNNKLERIPDHNDMPKIGPG
ncbi:hypothetical protein M231_04222 [Tremella mesenterica]|uniref:Uncharacterized protein n=1 Tax=Tremella mesenterica TaxID=5217 RepID=A0A4V1M3Y2_TREME|nr:hypothetical protein M231_04222 [Tremella mesenterica]